MTGLLDAALGYSNRRRQVFPLKPRAKAPATPHGVKDATTDADQVRAWWTQMPNANIGCATGTRSGFWSLDIDGDDGEATLAALEAEHGPLPPTIELITGGGRQLFFRCGLFISNSVRKLGPGLDTRGDGGYTILPPSIHPSGRPYAWSVDGHPDEFSLTDAPRWLLAKVQEDSSKQVRPTSRWRSMVRDGVSEGERNTSIASLTGHLLAKGVDPLVALELVQSWNATSCAPPLGADEVERTVNSIAARELDRRRRDPKGRTA